MGDDVMLRLIAPRIVIALLAGLCSAMLAYASEPPALVVPPVVNSYETFEIQVAGPGGRGDMLRFADAAGKVLGGSYAYVGNAKNGVLKLTAPVESGEYAVVYLAEREVVARYPLTVRAVTATLQAAASVQANGHLEVSFTGPRNNGDYLQFTDNSGVPVRGLYAYVGNAKGNTLRLRAPADAGSYAVAYFTGKQPIGSVAVQVTGVEALLNVPDTVTEGAHFPVGWQGPDNSGDMLRVRDADGVATGSYGYTGNNPDTMQLRAPEEPGSYQVVYLTADRVIGTAAFTVVPAGAVLDAPAEVAGAERFEVAWEGPGNSGDTVQLIDPRLDDDVAYAYLDARRGATVMLLAPSEPGDYTLRYITHGGRTLASRPVTVTPPVREPGTLLVEPVEIAVLDPDDAVEVVLDASGSMLQRLAGERRIEIARRTLQSLVNDTIPPGTPFALRVFGHREADSCRTDLEIPLAPLDRQAASAVIAGVQAMNLAKTPIADSLARTEADLAGVTGERVIVLLTDGEETCDGSPADVIAALRAGGNEVRISIVGLAIDDAALEKTFARWAELGGGAYFPVAEESALGAALVSAVNPVFTVRDAQGEEVATGVAGGDPVSLMPGNYSVEVAGRSNPVEIRAAQATRLSL
tara:strand:+ start:7821 stop:9731 length:1911 start_codon:yes stop_codon:yes gene_type:complete